LEDKGFIAMGSSATEGEYWQALDYGCGRGTDADYMREEGYLIDKYDPYYFSPVDSDPRLTTRDVTGYAMIFCTYVLNVVAEDEADRILEDIKRLLHPGGVAYITVRRDIKKEGITSKRTLQRNVVLDLPIVHEKKKAYCIYKLERSV